MKFNIKIKIKIMALSCCIAFMVTQNVKSVDIEKTADPAGCKACIDTVNKNPNCTWKIPLTDVNPLPEGDGIAYNTGGACQRANPGMANHLTELTWCMCEWVIINKCNEKCKVPVSKEIEEEVQRWLDESDPNKPVETAKPNGQKSVETATDKLQDTEETDEDLF